MRVLRQGSKMDILVEQEVDLHQYKTRQTKADIERLIHPCFSEIGKSGNSYDFTSTIELMKKEEPSSIRIHSQKFECIQLEPSVQLLKYETALVDELNEVSSYAKRSSIWVNTGTCWQLKFHQGTPCQPFELESADIL